MLLGTSSRKKNTLAFVIHEHVSTINVDHWNSVNKDKNLYLSLPYLSAIEESLQPDFKFYYLIFYTADGTPAGIAYTQLVPFVDRHFHYKEQISKISNRLKDRILNALHVKILVCGNVFSSGENGFTFMNSVDDDLAFQSLNNALYELRKVENIKKETSIVVLKEFWPESFNKTSILEKWKYHEFMIDVNMVLDIRPEWQTFDDYLACMNTKFRTKAKGVFKKSASLVSKDLSVTAIVEHKDRIEKLYDDVVTKANFHLGELNASAFIHLKEQLSDKFRVQGYFLEDKLIGFSSAFILENMIEANYVGIDYEYNIAYAVYQRMLYDFVQLSIAEGSKELHLGRTSEEIKSGVGALPVDMKLYIKHFNHLSNKVLGPLFETIAPSSFELRKPFKKQL